MSQVLGTPPLKEGASPSLPIAANQFGDKIVCLQTEMTMKTTWLFRVYRGLYYPVIWGL